MTSLIQKNDQISLYHNFVLLLSFHLLVDFLFSTDSKNLLRLTSFSSNSFLKFVQLKYSKNFFVCLKGHSGIKFLTSLKINFTKFEHSTTIRFRDTEWQIRFPPRKAFSSYKFCQGSKLQTEFQKLLNVGNSQ